MTRAVRPGDAPISRREAREIIDERSGKVGLRWYFTSIVIIAAAIAGISLFTSPAPVSVTDYLAYLVLVVFEIAALSFLVIVHSKSVSFDGDGIVMGWSWAAKRRCDWDEVVALDAMAFVPGVALLKLRDETVWPVFMDLDNAKHLSDAISIWKDAV